MLFSKFSQRGQFCCLTVMLLCLASSGILAQTIKITAPANSSQPYQIGVTNLGPHDLVFYRFSDGYDYSGTPGVGDPEASIKRTFRFPNTNVSAYVAKKGGPIYLLTTNVGNNSCTNCSPTYPSASSISLKSSWNPSTNPFPALTDNTTLPACTFPLEPWYFMAVTMTNPAALGSADVSIPTGMEVTGAIIKGIYIPISSGGGYNVGDTDIDKIKYTSSNVLTIEMTANVEQLVNVYLVIKNNTEFGAQSVFNAQMFEANRKPLTQIVNKRVFTHSDPHDPNSIIPYQEGPCAATSQVQYLTYRVDFQNLGEGTAKNVHVKVWLNPAVFDLSAVPVYSGSHLITSVNSHLIYHVFNLENINLPGTGGAPQPSIDDTKGWIEFTVATKPCISQNLYFFTTSADITFSTPATGFRETVQTNRITQRIRVCEKDEACGITGGGGTTTDPGPGGGGGHDGGEKPADDPNRDDRNSTVVYTGSSDKEVFAAKCYPSFFSDIIRLTFTADPGDGLLSVIMSDMTGRIWINNSYQAIEGMETLELLETNNLPSGMYVIHVKQGKNISVFKAIKP